MLTELVAASQGVKTLFELIKATQGLSNSTAVLTAVSDVQQKLIDANAAALASQEKQASLAEQVRELEAQLRDSEDWQREMQRYHLVEFPTKALALKLRVDMANGEPMHHLCKACADKKQKTTLQPLNGYLVCPESRYHSIHQIAGLPTKIPNPNSAPM